MYSQFHIYSTQMVKSFWVWLHNSPSCSLNFLFNNFCLANKTLFNLNRQRCSSTERTISKLTLCTKLFKVYFMWSKITRLIYFVSTLILHHIHLLLFLQKKKILQSIFKPLLSVRYFSHGKHDFFSSDIPVLIGFSRRVGKHIRPQQHALESLIQQTIIYCINRKKSKSIHIIKSVCRGVFVSLLIWVRLLTDSIFTHNFFVFVYTQYLLNGSSPLFRSTVCCCCK